MGTTFRSIFQKSVAKYDHKYSDFKELVEKSENFVVHFEFHWNEKKKLGPKQGRHIRTWIKLGIHKIVCYRSDV